MVPKRTMLSASSAEQFNICVSAMSLFNTEDVLCFKALYGFSMVSVAGLLSLCPTPLPPLFFPESRRWQQSSLIADDSSTYALTLAFSLHISFLRLALTDDLSAGRLAALSSLYLSLSVSFNVFWTPIQPFLLPYGK